MQGRGTGALVFTETPTVNVPEATLNTASLSALLSAAKAFEAGTLEPNAAFRKLVEGSSRAGGARPKALVHDKEGEWLAKFRSATRDGRIDVVGLEATCLTLARGAGLWVPDSRLEAIGRQRVLLVRRFDVTPQGGRIHMVSMRTLCLERPGVFALSYSELARVIEKHSAAPAVDVAMLFRHMVFNAAIGNVDDHLKNFWMLATPAGYRLAPAFDLVPDITGRGEHTLAFEYDAACPTRQQLRALATQWSVAHAEEILDQVVRAVKGFAATAKKLRVRVSGGTETVCADIERRVKLIQKS